MELLKLISDFILGLTSNLAWPVVLIISVYLFKRPLSKLIERTESVSKDGAKFYEYQSIVAQLETCNAHAALQIVTSNTDPVAIDLKNILKQELNALIPEGEHIKREELILIRLAESRLKERYEKTYQAIFGSQIKALSRLRETNDNIIEDYNLHVSRIKSDQITGIINAEIKVITFESWIGFLINSEFIMFVDNKYILTNLGAAFLRYIIATNYPLDKAY